MNEISYKNIPDADQTQIVELFDIMLCNLSRPEFFYRTQEDLDRLFDKKYQLHIGAYDGEKLVGMASLFIDQKSMKDYKQEAGITCGSLCEFGNYVVHPKYRSKGIMAILQKEILQLARDLKFKYAVAAAHPDNIASIKVLSKIFTPCKIIDTDGGFFLQLFVMKIK